MGRGNWIKHQGLVALTALAFIAPTSAMAQFLSLSDEAKVVATLIKCPSPSLPRYESYCWPTSQRLLSR